MNHDFEHLYSNWDDSKTRRDDLSSILKQWQSSTLASPDIYRTDTLNGYFPYSGKMMAGLFLSAPRQKDNHGVLAELEYREYLKVPLSRPIHTADILLFEMYVAKHPKFALTAKHIDIAFDQGDIHHETSGAITKSSVYNLPLDLNNSSPAWEKIEVVIIPKDTFTHIHIGNFQ